MFSVFVSVLTILCSSFRTRAAVQLEILALRHQINVLRRSQPVRVRLTTLDRFLWAWLLPLWSRWRSALIIVKPETVMAWHRRGFRLYWTWKSRQSTPGRPKVSREVRDLIRPASNFTLDDVYMGPILKERAFARQSILSERRIVS